MRPGPAPVQAGDELPALLVGHGRDRAGVYHHDVGHVAVGGACHAPLGQRAAYRRRLGEVELASQREIGSLHLEIFQTTKVRKKRETATTPLSRVGAALSMRRML